VKRRALFVAVGVVIGLSVGYAISTLLYKSESPEPSPSKAADQAKAVPKSASNSPRIKSWRFVEDFDQEIAVFDTVFWDPQDTESLRKLIRDGSLVEGKTVLEIGTGSGLLALCCLKAGAEQVVATDVNRAAVSNSLYNAEHLKLTGRLDARLVSLENSSAFSVIAPNETFDLIISNPPWVNQKPKTIEEHALYDANFALMKSLLSGLRDHLKPGGRVLLAYGCVDAIKTLQELSKEHHFEFIIRDERNLDELPEEFLPGMLLEIRTERAETGGG
jgi:release factor glutamine methyltransferase